MLIGFVWAAAAILAVSFAWYQLVEDYRLVKWFVNEQLDKVL